MDNKELARRICAERRQMAEQNRRKGIPPPPYYMMNFTHPVIQAIYERWRADNHLCASHPPGDIERTEFELELLSASARQAMAEHYARIDAMHQLMPEECKNGGSTNGTNCV